MPELLDPAPPLAGSDYYSSRSLDLADHRGSPGVVAFMGLTWCGPCRREAPALQSAYEALRPDGFKFVIVSTAQFGFVGEDPDALRPYYDDLGLTIPVIAATPSIMTDWSPPALPTVFFLTRDHRLHREETGADPIPAETRAENIATVARRAARYPSEEEARGCALAFLAVLDSFRRRNNPPGRHHGSDSSPTPQM